MWLLLVVRKDLFQWRKGRGRGGGGKYLLGVFLLDGRRRLVMLERFLIGLRPIGGSRLGIGVT